MRTKILLFLTFLMCGVVSAQVQDTIRTLIITEVRLDDARRGYVEITNVGTEAIDLSEFEIGKIEPWSTPLNNDYAPNADYFIMLPDQELAPGESFLLAMVYDWGPEMWLLAPEDYDPLLTKREMWTLADIQMHYPESPTNAATDSVSPAYHLLEFWGGRECVYLRQHRYDAGGVHVDSILIDQVNGIWRGTDGTRFGGGDYSPIDVAGFTNASRDATLVRKFSVKKGNMDFESGRGEDLTESEWLPIPHQAGGAWADNVRRLFWTAKTHGDFNLTEESFVPANDAITVDWTNYTITVPWGIGRDDSIMMQFEKSPGYAWHYDYAASYADSASTAAKTDDTLTVYVCGNDLDIQKFAIIVTDPTNDVNIVVPKKAPNDDGFYAGVNDPLYVVSTGLVQDYIGTARFGGIPFATRADTLMKYLEKPANAAWEIVWKNGTERTDLVDGDLLRVTAANGTSVKDYYIKVDQQRKSHNAYLSAITWPDIPDDFRGLYGWIGDTVPNFAITKYSYTVRVPEEVNGIPALVGKTQDINAKTAVERATNIYGSIADATVTFNTTAEDDTSKLQYAVQLVKQKNDTLIQPFNFEPFISEFVWQDQWASGFIEVVNPGEKILDMSKYMFSWGYVNTPAEAITRLAGTGDWANRFGKYIPGYKWQDSTNWKVQPAIAIEDPNVFPMVAPNDVFVIGDVRTTGQVPAADRVYKTLFGNTVTHWWATLQCDIELATGRNPWNEEVPNWNALQQWNGANWYFFKIDNDSITAGLKPATDPNDFTLLDVFGSGDGSAFLVGGLTSCPQTATYIRKPEIWHGNTDFKGSFGTDASTSEWLRHDRSYFDARGVPWPYDILYITQDLGSHFMDPVTHYKSTITSSVYKVSQGYKTEDLLGIVAGTTVAQLEARIIKADDAQTLTYKSGTDGSLLIDTDILENNDTLVVVSADGSNTTKYVLEVTAEGSLSDDAVLTSLTLTINQDGKNGTISGFDFGTTLKVVYDQVVVPEGATLLILDADSAYVPFTTLKFDTSYVETMVNGEQLFEVLAENGINRIVYTLQPTSANTDAFVTSYVFDVDQERALIDLLPGGLNGFPAISAPAFLANLIPAPGATMVLKDKLGFERLAGFVVKDDILEVTAADGTTQKTYHLKFVGEMVYIGSVVYQVNQLLSSIEGSAITNEITVATFLANITSSQGATVIVTDANGTEKAATDLMEPGDKLVATSSDGFTERIYLISVIVSVNNSLESDVVVFPNPSDGRFNITGLRTGNRIQVFNIVGTLVLDKYATGDNEPVNIQKQRSGIYFITVSDNANVVGRYKVVKE